MRKELVIGDVEIGVNSTYDARDHVDIRIETAEAKMSVVKLAGAPSLTETRVNLVIISTPRKRPDEVEPCVEETKRAHTDTRTGDAASPTDGSGAASGSPSGD